MGIASPSLPRPLPPSPSSFRPSPTVAPRTLGQPHRRTRCGSVTTAHDISSPSSLVIGVVELVGPSVLLGIGREHVAAADSRSMGLANVVRLVSAVVRCHRYCIRWRDIRRRTRLARTASEGGMKSELHRYEKDGMPNPV
ncbi:hypothetical protein PIB30_054515 [Stylosanthes scabra]|uniref:Uncharacterized protein n=1 Tax=Stylosanthes scabra TaxID=79078 RepID=A0ABU6UJM9_9FABA|nr:hypothetical protein [Stylosanthes scabra]